MARIDKKIRESLKKSLIASCRKPLEAIYEITKSRDTDRNKLIAIQVFCRKTLEVVNKTIRDNLS